MRNGALVALAAGALVAAADAALSRRIAFDDLPSAVQRSLSAVGIDAAAFPAFIARVEDETARRVAEGEREHLIYYALQSTRFTSRRPIEPARSAQRFIDGLPPGERERILADPAYVPPSGWPPPERARVVELLGAVRGSPKDPRLTYFGELLRSSRVDTTPDALYPDYVRVARFLYQKEFGAPGAAAAGVADMARLYQLRPHSSDTQIEAGFGVYLGLGTLHGLDPAFRATNVLVVGPGLNLAPRTDLIDAVEPQSYQPFAVADAMLSLSLASEAGLHVQSIDVNPRVVGWLQGVARDGVTLRFFTGFNETSDRPFSPEYRTYVRNLGRAIGTAAAASAAVRSAPRYQHSISVRPAIARAIGAARLNVVIERFETAFDVVVATNVLTYFDDRELALALANIGAMLRPGGYLLHNEARAGLVEAADSVGLPTLHTRTAVLAGSAERTMYDVVYLHQRKK